MHVVLWFLVFFYLTVWLLGLTIITAFVIQCQKQPGKDSGTPGSAMQRAAPASPEPSTYQKLHPGIVFVPYADNFWLLQVQEFLSVPYPLPFPACHSGFQLKSNFKLWNAFPQPYQHPVASMANALPKLHGWDELNRARDTPFHGHSFVGQPCSSPWSTQTAATKPYQGSEEAERGSDMMNIQDYSEPPLIIPVFSNCWASRPICPSNRLKLLHMAKDDNIPAFRMINSIH